MWFSNVLAKTIKKLFGDYIEGLDSISLPIWSGGMSPSPPPSSYLDYGNSHSLIGDVALENLTINKKQLTTPELPIEVIQGIPSTSPFLLFLLLLLLLLLLLFLLLLLLLFLLLLLLLLLLLTISHPFTFTH